LYARHSATATGRVPPAKLKLIEIYCDIFSLVASAWLWGETEHSLACGPVAGKKSNLDSGLELIKWLIKKLEKNSHYSTAPTKERSTKSTKGLAEQIIEVVR